MIRPIVFPLYAHSIDTKIPPWAVGPCREWDSSGEVVFNLVKTQKLGMPECWSKMIYIYINSIHVNWCNFSKKKNNEGGNLIYKFCIVLLCARFNRKQIEKHALKLRTPSIPKLKNASGSTHSTFLNSPVSTPWVPNPWGMVAICCCHAGSAVPGVRQAGAQTKPWPWKARVPWERWEMDLGFFLCFSGSHRFRSGTICNNSSD